MIAVNKQIIFIQSMFDLLTKIKVKNICLQACSTDKN